MVQVPVVENEAIGNLDYSIYHSNKKYLSASPTS